MTELAPLPETERPGTLNLALTRLRSLFRPRAALKRAWQRPALPTSPAICIESELDRVRHSFVGLDDPISPTPEQIAARHRREKEVEELEMARMDAVREAYWANTADDDPLMEAMGTALNWALNIPDPPKNLRYILFSAIPADMLCRGLLVGFRDAGLVNMLCEWSRERHGILRRISAMSHPAPANLDSQSVTHDRDTMVRLAFWSKTSYGDAEMFSIVKAIILATQYETPSWPQCLEVFLELPLDLFAKGMRWGFGDTEVRTQIYTWAYANAQTIANAVERAAEAEEITR